MKYKYLLLLLFSLLFFSCEMKKEILGQTDKGQTLSLIHISEPTRRS